MRFLCSFSSTLFRFVRLYTTKAHHWIVGIVARLLWLFLNSKILRNFFNLNLPLAYFLLTNVVLFVGISQSYYATLRRC